MVRIPAAMISVLMLGSGTEITRELIGDMVPVVWVGEGRPSTWSLLISRGSLS